MPRPRARPSSLQQRGAPLAPACFRQRAQLRDLEEHCRRLCATNGPSATHTMAQQGLQGRVRRAHCRSADRTAVTRDRGFAGASCGVDTHAHTHAHVCRHRIGAPTGAPALPLQSAPRRVYFAGTLGPRGWWSWRRGRPSLRLTEGGRPQRLAAERSTLAPPSPSNHSRTEKERIACPRLSTTPAS